MATSPKFKIYSGPREYVAACKYAEDAAAIVSNYFMGTIRLGHTKKDILWLEGSDGAAADSFDVVAETVYTKEADIIRRASYKLNKLPKRSLVI